jgi:Arc/MetJ-type ribon-helix-helix transcriptional regulator
MTKDVTVCFRFDGITDQQITQLLGERYPTRSRFIRAAIEHLLSKEDARVRQLAAHRSIQRG